MFHWPRSVGFLDGERLPDERVGHLSLEIVRPWGWEREEQQNSYSTPSGVRPDRRDTVSKRTMTRPFQAFDSWNQRRTAAGKNLVRVGGSQPPQLPWKLAR